MSAVAKSAEVDAWEAQAEIDIGTLIHSYLLTHPVPGTSTVADDLMASGEALMKAGHEHLGRLGRPRLAIAGGGT